MEPWSNGVTCVCCSEEHPNSFWQCYSVLWDDEGVDLLSPWDMEPIPAPVEGEEDGEGGREERRW